MMRYHFLLMLCTVLWLSNCDNDDDGPQGPDTGVAAGVFITNEGLFNQANGSLSFFEFESETLETRIFQDANGRPLGDIFQSMTIIGDLAYLVLNNSQRVEIMDIDTRESLGAIEGFTSPRHLLSVNDSLAYVSDLFAGQLSIVNLERGIITGSIPMPEDWTEEMRLMGDEVFVVAPTSFNQPPNDQLYIVDTETHSLADSLTVGFSPSALAVDSDGRLWVLCSGDSDSGTPGGLYQVDTENRKVLKTLPFPDTNVGFAPRMEASNDGSRLYYINIDLFEVGINAEMLPAEPFIEAGARQLYGLGVEPGTGNVWLGDAVDFQSQGAALRYDALGSLVDSVGVGISPNGFYFYEN